MDDYKLMAWMLRELSSMTHGYFMVVEGCYDAAVNHYGFLPTSTKKEIVDKVMGILVQMNTREHCQ